MGLRQKFFILAGLSGLLMAIVSIVGYFNAYSNLEASVEGELTETVEAQQKQLDGWLSANAAIATGAANIMTALNGNDNVANMIEILSLADNNSDILEVGVGNEKAQIFDYNSFNINCLVFRIYLCCLFIPEFR